MASKGDISAGRAFISLYLKGSAEVQAGLNKIAGKFKAMGAAMMQVGGMVSGVGGAILGPILAMTKNFASVGDDIAKMAKRTGISVEALSQLAFAAEQSGTSLADFENGIRRMQKSLVDAARGSGAAKEAFDALGLSTADMMKLSPEDQFKAIAQAISEVEDPTMKAALAMAIFGKSGTGLLPLLNEGAEGLSKLMDEADSLGRTLSPEDAKNAEELSDAMNRVVSVVKGVALQIGAALAPAITHVANAIAQATSVVVGFIRENRNLVIAIAGVGAVVMAIGGALITLGLTFTAISIAIGGLLTAFSALAAIVAFVFSPVGLLVAGIVALTVAIGAAVAWALKASGAFAGLGKMFGETWKAIIAAVQSGDLSLAFSIAVAQVKVVWQQLLNSLKSMWDDFKSYVNNKFMDLPGAELLFPEARKKMNDDAAQRKGERDADLDKLQRELADLQKEAIEGTTVNMPKGAKFQFTDQASAAIQEGMQGQLTDRQRGTFSGDFASTRLGQGVVNTKENKAQDAMIEGSKTLKDILDEVKGLSLDFA